MVLLTGEAAAAQTVTTNSFTDNINLLKALCKDILSSERIVPNYDFKDLYFDSVKP